MKSKERRLAAIMFTDIVGYSSMMQKDEDLANRMRVRHREVFNRLHDQHGGKILQYFGDGTLSIFPSTTAAVECAVALQQTLKKEPQVPIRVGIHTGDIVVGDLSLRGRSEFAAVGEQANLAAEIEGYTRQKQVRILISETTAKAVESTHSLKSRGTVALEGGRLEVFELGAKQ